MNNVLAIAGLVVKELYRRKDFYVLFVLVAVLTLLLASASAFNERGAVKHIKELCLLLIWIASLVIAIMTAARQIPSERENRTILPLMAKPVTRWELILGKFAGCWIASGLALVTFYGFFALVSGWREGHWPLTIWAQALLLHWTALGIVTALALFGSVTLTTPSANATICFVAAAGILMIGRHLNKVAVSLAEPAGTIVYAVYYIVPHLEFFDLRELVIHNWSSVPLSVFLLAVLYGIVYAAVFLIATWAVFRRQSLR